MKYDVQALIDAKKAYVVAAAGCGKTEIIADAISLSVGKQLILTHTHAGVDSLKARLQKKGIDRKKYLVDTIASWSLHYVISYPVLSGSDLLQPHSSEEWRKTYEAAETLLKKEAMISVIKQSYTGVFIDEYQDCTENQHEIVQLLANILPLRLLGDPLQGIFGFGKEKIIDWQRDIYPHFVKMSELDFPWRWHPDNKELGAWLHTIRSTITQGTELSLINRPFSVQWREKSMQNLMSVSYGHLSKDGSVLIIGHMPHHCHSLGKMLSGKYMSMDEVEGKDLLQWSEKIDLLHGYNKAAAVIEFACACMTKISTPLKKAKEDFLDGREPKVTQASKIYKIIEKLKKVSADEDSSSILDALEAIYQLCKVEKGGVYRELWRDMKRTLVQYQEGEEPTVKEAALKLRNQTRIIGRKLHPRLISRTLLVKGLEFDHVIIADADALSRKELYVALTRAKKTVTILSKKQNISLN